MHEIPDRAPVAAVAGRYRVREILGAGGMGTVWRATDELLGRDVAVKRVRLDTLAPAEAATARERTMREARIAAALHHPNVVSIFDVVVEAGEPWLVLEFLPSRSLGSVLGEHTTLAPADVAAIGAQVAAALAAAHAAGIVHRDVKPENILVARRPATLPGSGAPLVKLTDFGIAHAAGAPAITATHVLTGTPAYFAPETARGDGTDSRSDVYSLGATLYAAVEGRPPFGDDQGNLLGLLSRIARGGVPPPDRAGPLTGLIRRLTADDPAARPAAAQAYHELLQLSGGPGAYTGAGAPTVPVDGIRPPRRRRAPVVGPVIGPVVAAVGVLAVAAVAVTAAVLGLAPGGGPAGGAAPGPAVAPTSVPAPPTSGRATVPVPGYVSIGESLTADPCSVLDTAALEPFGSVELDPDNVRFAGCRADVTAPTDTVTVTTVFETVAEALGTPSTERPDYGQLTVIRTPQDYDMCERRIMLSDGFAVHISASTLDGPAGPTDLCAVAEAATGAAVTIMAEEGIRERTPMDVAMQLGGVDACGLLTAPDLAVVPGLHLSQRAFRGWGCDWTTTAGPATDVAVLFYRGGPLTDDDGAVADFAGRPGRVLSREGNCWVQFVQRNYRAGTTPRVEAVWVTVHGPQPDVERCAIATTLANAAAAKLPPPS